MGIEQGLLSKPASRYTNTTFNRAFIKGQLQQQMQQSLLTQAAAHVPDTKAITKQMGDMVLHAGDKQAIGQIVNENLSAFNKDYTENPFNAFTKKSKTRISNISQALNNPAIAQFAARKERDDQVLKTADSAGLTGNLQINGNQIKVVNGRGESDWINIDVYQKNRDKFRALKVGEDYGIISTTGASRGAQPFTVNMNEYSDILARASKLFDDAGSNKGTQFTGDANILQTIKSSDNITQLKKAYDFLINNGLSNNDWNTLISDYVDTHQGATYGEAKMGVIQSLIKLKESNREREVDATQKVNPTLTAQGTSAAITGNRAMAAVDRLAIGDQQTDRWTANSTQGNLEGNNLSGTLYTTKASNYGGVIDLGTDVKITNDAGDKIKSKLVADNTALKNLITSGLNNQTIRYIDGNGKLQKATGDMFSNSLYMNTPESSPKIVKHLKDNQGNPASFDDMKLMTAYEESLRQATLHNESNAGKIPLPAIPAKLDKYFVDVDEGKQALYGDYMTFANLTQITDNGAVTENTVDRFREGGVRIAGDNTKGAFTQEIYDYFNKHSGQDPTNNIDDDVAVTDVLVEVQDMNLLRIDLKGDVYALKDDLKTQDYFDRNYKIFVPSASLSTNSQISNRVSSKNFSPSPK